MTTRHIWPITLQIFRMQNHTVATNCCLILQYKSIPEQLVTTTPDQHIVQTVEFISEQCDHIIENDNDDNSPRYFIIIYYRTIIQTADNRIIESEENSVGYTVTYELIEELMNLMRDNDVAFNSHVDNCLVPGCNPRLYRINIYEIDTPGYMSLITWTHCIDNVEFLHSREIEEIISGESAHNYPNMLITICGRRRSLFYIFEDSKLQDILDFLQHEGYIIEPVGNAN